MKIVNQVFRSRKNILAYSAMLIAAIYLTSVFVVPIGASAFSASSLASTTPKVVLRPFTVVAGKSVKVTGTHFTATDSVSVSFNGGTVATGTVNSTGGFVANFVVPSGTATGSYTVTAKDSSGVTASNTLSVTTTSTKLTLKVTATAHRDGATATVSGNNFLPSTTVTVTFRGDVVGTATTNSSGGFTLTFVVQHAPAGTFFISATDGTNTIAKSFTVSAFITVSPNVAAPGAMVTVNGTGFAQNAPITLTLGTTSITVTPTTNNYGSFQMLVQIPTSMAKGGYSMTAADNAGHSATAHVRVT